SVQELEGCYSDEAAAAASPSRSSSSRSIALFPSVDAPAVDDSSSVVASTSASMDSSHAASLSRKSACNSSTLCSSASAPATFRHLGTQRHAAPFLSRPDQSRRRLRQVLAGGAAPPGEMSRAPPASLRGGS